MKKNLVFLALSFAMFGFDIPSIQSAKANSIPAYEVRIITKRPNHVYSPLVGNPGHATIALFNEKGELVQTKGMWPSGLQTNNSTDKGMALGSDCGWWGCIWRGAKVTKDRGEWIMNSVATSNNTNCWSYNVRGGQNSCNCVTFTTRVWQDATARRELFGNIDPQSLAISLASRNATDGRYLDSGKVWR